MVFLILSNCPSMFPCISLNFLKFFIKQIIDLRFFRVSCWKIIGFLWWYPCFLDFSYFSKSCFAVFTFEVKLPPAVFTDWLQRKGSSMGPAQDSEAFSELFCGYSCSMFLFLLGKGILRLYAISQFCKVMPGANSLPFVSFLSGSAENPQVYGLYQFCRVGPAFHMCSLAIY